MPHLQWKSSLKAFFDERADGIGPAPTTEDLCFIAGRDPRLWADIALYEDLIESIVCHCALDGTSNAIEVGCASGFLARGIAPRVSRFHGVDHAPQTIEVARRLALPNAAFSVSEGSKLAFDNSSFDAAICYDVFTNFPTIDDGAPLIREMLRVVKPGGRVLVGSIPDSDLRDRYQERVDEVQAELHEKHGPVAERPARQTDGVLRQFLKKFRREKLSEAPVIVGYYFRREDFTELGDALGAKTEISQVHGKNPYSAFRFNAIYQKPLE
ncbi:class I SAM-dependent methyltransferase [Bosea sp. (in: a-proteobacteria)]|uniref:class I SAM-dependent methyltransferase n=1 Tax=Bosea sp. (in: a-proteobacteria) TaxID=1871050 RepID=UPI002603A9E7|nr:class I SAM-dependent methyltransferase [Bosea sp. (in: a-proteobacteria)]MCO5092073.1 class I SAM-dependent methyltransferase [Bosea sp. (in: a-proteobacteria)]